MRYIRRKNGDVFLHIDDVEKLIRDNRPVERPDGPSIYFAEEGRRGMCDLLTRELNSIYKQIEARIAERRSREGGRRAVKAAH